MPDSIAVYRVNGVNYVVSANEGDARSEEQRVSTLNLDATLTAPISDLKGNAKLGRLGVSNIDGDTDGDGDFDQLFAYGARSFSIWADSVGAERPVFDSGDDLERITAQVTPTLFNTNDGLLAQFDTRSDNKGPEPEGLAVGEIDGRYYAFVGLERAGGGIMVYEISNPQAPRFVQYVRSDQDISPEGVLFIPAAASPNGKPLVVLSHEVSNNVTIYQI